MTVPEYKGFPVMFNGRRICVDSLVAGELIETCPFCKHVLLIFRPDGLDVPGREHWLTDGDTIPGILGHLRSDQEKPDAHYFSLSVGKCPNCSGDYYAVFPSLIDADMSDGLDGLEPDDFLSFNVPMSLEKIASCILEGPNPGLSWTMETYRTPFGPMHHHTFGPFPLQYPETVIHPEYGVMACQTSEGGPWSHGKSIILSLFDEMRGLIGNADRRR